MSDPRLTAAWLVGRRLVPEYGIVIRSVESPNSELLATQVESQKTQIKLRPRLNSSCRYRYVDKYINSFMTKRFIST